MKLWKLLILALALSACKNLNNQPGQSGSLSVEVGSLQRQMGVQPNYAGGGTGSSVDSFMLGVVILEKGQGIYRNDQIVDPNLKVTFGDALVNSEGYLKMYSLPLRTDFLNVELPPENSKRFQIVAIGFAGHPKGVWDIQTGMAIYFAFSEDSYRTQDLANGTIQLNMQRPCMMNPTPDGCAIFGPTLADAPRVTAMTEIVGFKVNGKSYFSKAAVLPIIVATPSEATNAVSQLQAVQDEIVASGVGISRLSVLITHRNSQGESAACRALIGEPDPYNSLMISNCFVSEHQVYY